MKSFAISTNATRMEGTLTKIHSKTTTTELIPAAQQVIDTIAQCKALVRCMKKV